MRQREQNAIGQQNIVLNQQFICYGILYPFLGGRRLCINQTKFPFTSTLTQRVKAWQIDGPPGYSLPVYDAGWGHLKTFLSSTSSAAIRQSRSSWLDWLLLLFSSAWTGRHKKCNRANWVERSCRKAYGAASEDNSCHAWNATTEWQIVKLVAKLSQQTDTDLDCSRHDVVVSQRALKQPELLFCFGPQPYFQIASIATSQWVLEVWRFSRRELSLQLEVVYALEHVQLLPRTYHKKSECDKNNKIVS